MRRCRNTGEIQLFPGCRVQASAHSSRYAYSTRGEAEQAAIRFRLFVDVDTGHRVDRRLAQLGGSAPPSCWAASQGVPDAFGPLSAALHCGDSFEKYRTVRSPRWSCHSARGIASGMARLLRAESSASSRRLDGLLRLTLASQIDLRSGQPAEFRQHRETGSYYLGRRDLIS